MATTKKMHELALEWHNTEKNLRHECTKFLKRILDKYDNCLTWNEDDVDVFPSIKGIDVIGMEYEDNTIFLILLNGEKRDLFYVETEELYTFCSFIEDEKF